MDGVTDRRADEHDLLMHAVLQAAHLRRMERLPDAGKLMVKRSKPKARVARQDWQTIAALFDEWQG